ncbi:S41 family peptidase [Methylobacterium sp.]|uniref:S41 family peptidase n=3 Tax=Methylobacterium sp. TaxID=409 RepID=UPI003C7939A2
MRRRRSVVAAVFCTTVLANMAAPSISKADISTESLKRAPLAQDTVRKVVNGIAAELREGYVFPDLGKQAADAIQRDLDAHAYAKASDPGDFATQLTERLRSLTSDNHVRVIHGDPFANRPKPLDMRGAGFQVKRLEGNVGYIHLASFVPSGDFKPAADKAMQDLSDTAALIVDMRDNGGGHPASVAYLVSFFLDPSQRVHINDLIWRNRGTTSFRTESFWSSPTRVSYLGKPVYVLVGPKTYSAGEEFAYDLQALKRATIVGEKTRGSANPGGLNELGSDFFVVVPTGRAENPITGGNWGGVGVRPNVSATSEVTQEAALALATRDSKL